MNDRHYSHPLEGWQKFKEFLTGWFNLLTHTNYLQTQTQLLFSCKCLI